MRVNEAAFFHDCTFPGSSSCITTGKTREETEERMHEAIEMHIRGLIEDGMPVPESHSSAIFVAVDAELILHYSTEPVQLSPIPADYVHYFTYFHFL